MTFHSPTSPTPPSSHTPPSDDAMPSPASPRRERRRVVIILVVLIAFAVLYVFTLRTLNLAFVDVAKFPYMDPTIPLVGESIIPPPDWKPTQQSWYAAALDHAQRHPASTVGLRHHADAVDQFSKYNQSLLARRSSGGPAGYLHDEVRTYLSNGATSLTPELKTALANTSSILTLAFAAGAVAPYTMPESGTYDRDTPGMLLEVLLIRLMAVQSDESARAGDANLAVRQATAAYGFAASYCSPRTQPYSFFTGYEGMRASERALQQHLRHPSVTTDTALFAAQSLQRFDTQRAPISEAIREMGRSHILAIRAVTSDMDRTYEIRGERLTTEKRIQNHLMLATLPPPGTFEAHCDRFFRQLAQSLNVPAGVSQFKRNLPALRDPAGLPRYLRFPVNSTRANLINTLVTSDDSMTTRTRALQTQALQRAGRDTTESIILRR